MLDDMDVSDALKRKVVNKRERLGSERYRAIANAVKINDKICSD